MSDGRDELEGGGSPDDSATFVPGGGASKANDGSGARAGVGEGGLDAARAVGRDESAARRVTPSPSDEAAASAPGAAPDDGATIVPGGIGGSRGGDAGSGFGGGFAGSLADRFEILGPLGEGGMGVVFKARDTRLGREVALKRLKGDSAESHRLIDRFEREARTVAGLEHPNIVRIYSVFDDADGLVIEMELLDGGSLQQRIDMEGALPVEEVVRIGVQLCEALEAAHARGIVHRDIKPGNVLLTRRGTPKLADFGLAVERTKGGDGRQTVTGSLLGTPHYAAPEQLIDGKGVDARADLYALGATLYAASTGTSPRMIKIDRLPETLRSVIEKCLEERAEDRYQTASEMAEALRETSGKATTTRLPASRSSAVAVGVCEKCGASNEADVKFCEGCGSGLFERCPKCSRELRAGTKFCGGCGVEVEVARKEMPAEEAGVVDLGSGVSMRLVEIKPGQFMMGSLPSERDRRDDETQREVTISKAFWLGQTPVTQEQWQAVMGSNPSRFKGDLNRPIESVSWDDAVEFCRRLSQKTGMTFRLPTEAEWEYACRAGTTTAYSFGDDPGRLDEYAWFNDNSDGSPQPVATKKPNARGLHDMHGNVWEWCSDWYDDYPSGAVTDPQGPIIRTFRVLRGGSWIDGSYYCRASYRGNCDPGSDYYGSGFRVARTP